MAEKTPERIWIETSTEFCSFNPETQIAGDPRTVYHVNLYAVPEGVEYALASEVARLEEDLRKARAGLETARVHCSFTGSGHYELGKMLGEVLSSLSENKGNRGGEWLGTACREVFTFALKPIGSVFSLVKTLFLWVRFAFARSTLR